MKKLSVLTATARGRRRLQLWLMVFWAPQVVLVFFLPQPLRIPYLIFCSVWANFAAHWAAYSAETPAEAEECRHCRGGE